MQKKYSELLNIEATIAKDLFTKVEHPWEALPLIKEFILEKINQLNDDYIKISDDVYVHKSATISPTAYIDGPTIIGENTEVRHCAYIRGSALIGNNCVIGNSTEIKNAIIFNNVQCPHYNYVGDAILGEYAHTGAGVILSNVKSDKKNIVLSIDGEKIETGLRKFSAIVGDCVEVGCNSVLCPGTIIWRDITTIVISESSNIPINTTNRGVSEPTKFATVTINE